MTNATVRVHSRAQIEFAEFVRMSVMNQSVANRCRTRKGRAGMLGAVLLACVVALAACGGDEVAETDASPGGDADSGGGLVATVPATEDEAASVQADGGVEWLGPDWLDLPLGFTPTWAYEQEADLDGLIQGDLAVDLTSVDAVAHVRGVMLDNGYSLVNDTPEWIVAVGPDGDFVQAGASGFEDPRTLSITFFTAKSAADMGFSATLDVLSVDLDGTVFEITGACSEGGEGFSGATGDSFVSISGEAPDYGIFMTITDPEGTEWSSLGGVITEISSAGFRMDTSLINDAGTFAETAFAATCN